jgi:putative transposase
MNAIAERWIGECRRELLNRTLIWNQAICGRSCARTRSTITSTGLTAPCKPLPEPVDLEQYRVRRQARVGGLINEYRLVAYRG